MRLLLSLLLLYIAAAGQPKIYFTYCAKADSLYRAGQFLQSAKMFNTAFESFRGKAQVYDRFKAARSWAIASEPDTALRHLEILVYQSRYGAFYKLSSDTGFKSLHPSQRWKNLIDTANSIIAANKIRSASLAKLYEPDLAARLDSIRILDQYFRKQLDETEKQFGRNSQEMKVLWEKIRVQDSINLTIVKQVLDTRGWLGPEIIHGGSNTLFLVIQHSDLNTQLKYLPMMREAVKNKNLDQGSLAMLEDRILLGQNKKQIYGTQVRRDSITGKRYVARLIDPDNVDKRRAEIGMGPISDYVSHWDLIWDPEAYKKELAEREKIK